MLWNKHFPVNSPTENIPNFIVTDIVIVVVIERVVTYF